MMGFSKTTALPLLLLLLFQMQLLLVTGSSSSNIASTTARVNVKDLFQTNSDCCRRFDGIGGLSGGGGTSRLLLDYPQDAWEEILDFLFKPNFGASLHMLKVEIGGDSFSTDGSESSHMHSQDDLNLERGYEWWLLKEAKKRNPDILTYGLPWAFPGWISEDKKDPFKHLDRITNYTLNWVKGAKEVHNIDIDYLGVWNEAGTSKDYLLELRKVLDKHGFDKVKLVSNDGNAQTVCPAMVNDTDYRNGADILGFHYPDDHQPDIWPLCNSLDKPIWSAEESSSYDDLNGAACWARVISSHYVLNNMTANIMWNLLGSYYHGTLWYASSMMTAVQPWSGYYEYEQLPVIWATAHYTQFLQVGWQYLPVGQGSGELTKGGYYTTLVSPDQKHFTVIVVKISRDHAPCTRPALWDWETDDEDFKLTIDLPGMCDGDGSETQTWYSNLEQEDTILFEKQEELVHSVSSKPGLCSYEISLNVKVGSVFSVTNQMNVGNKGEAKVKRDSDPRFPLPYYDDFNDYDCDNCYSKYLSDQNGAYEIQFVDDKKRKALVQMSPEIPVGWFSSGDKGPNTLIGMTEWEDVSVETSFRLPDPSSAACVATRASQLWGNGVSFCVNSTNWFLLYGGPKLTGLDASNVIVSGRASIVTSEWHNVSLVTQGDKVEASIEGTVVTSKDLTIRLGDSGFVMLGVSNYVAVQFGHIHIKAVGDAWSVPEPSTAEDSSTRTIEVGLCTPNGLTTDSERFDVTANWQIKHLASGQCVTVPHSTGEDPVHAEVTLTLQDCVHDHPQQQFRHKYTVLRNGNMVPLMNALGDLCGNKDGQASVSSSCSKDDSFAAWSLYPNTGQLRTSFGYDPKNGGRVHCLKATQGEGAQAQAPSKEFLPAAVEK